MSSYLDMKKSERSMSVATRITGPRVETWSSKEVCEELSITYRQLDLWVRSGLMAPSVSRAQGYGTARRFNFGDLVEIELIRQLLAVRVPMQSIKKALRHLRFHNLNLDALEGTYLVTDGEEYFVLYYSDGELDTELRRAMERGRPILSVALSSVIAAVRERLGIASRAVSRKEKGASLFVIEQIADAVRVHWQNNTRRTLELDKLLGSVLDRTGAEFGEIFLLDRSRKKLVLSAYEGLDDEPIQDKSEYEIGKGLPGLAAQTGEPIVRTYLGGEPRFMKRAQRKGVRFFACVPLKVGHIVIGTINVASMNPTLLRAHMRKR
jgi:DNA-binding transcriptional MerR regulator